MGSHSGGHVDRLPYVFDLPIARVLQTIDENLSAHGVPPRITLALSKPTFPSQRPVGTLATLAAFLISSFASGSIHDVMATFSASVDGFGFRPEFLFPAMALLYHQDSRRCKVNQKHLDRATMREHG